jgi:hypothetical protein
LGQLRCPDDVSDFIYIYLFIYTFIYMCVEYQEGP